MDGKSTGLRILKVEDSPVIALATEDMLRAFGYVPLGPVGIMASALELEESEEIDAAIVDLNIRGTESFTLLAGCHSCPRCRGNSCSKTSVCSRPRSGYSQPRSPK